MRTQTKNCSRKKISTMVGVLLLLAIIATSIFYMTMKNSTDSKNTENKKASTTSKQPSAQSDFGGQSAKSEPKPSTKQEGYATDVKIDRQPTGVAPSAVSNDDAIMIMSPAKDAVFKDGDTISGSSTYQRVNFRLMDNISGVIAQGSLAVTNGKFASAFHFSSAADEGAIELYTADQSGVESSNVSLPVRFK